ncbi:unnamed protein product, partial [Coregonus sp. 'balchen']
MPFNRTTILFGCNGTAHFHPHNKTLVLDSVRAEDEGVYEETVIYINNTMVLSSLHISVNSSHMLLTMTCEVKDARWLLGERNQTLQANNLTKADCGKYTCLVANQGCQTEGHLQLTDALSSVCRDKTAPATLLIGQRELFIMVKLGIIIACIRRYRQ